MIEMDVKVLMMRSDEQEEMRNVDTAAKLCMTLWKSGIAAVV